MTDDPKLNSGEWQMPDPVFRSTEGRTPKSAKEVIGQDDIDTASPDTASPDTADTDPDDIDTEVPETPEDPEAPVDPAKSAVEMAAPTISLPPPAPRAGGCAQTIGVLGIIAAAAIVTLLVVIYFLLSARPTETTF